MTSPILSGKTSRDQYGVDITVYGLASMERAMKAFTPDVAKAMNKSIRAALNVSRDKARGRIWDQPPMTGWRRNGGNPRTTWDPARMRGGITVNKGQAKGTRSIVGVAWRLQSTDAAATIFDKAENSHSTVGEQFIENLNRRGKAQRVLWPAWLQTRPDALRKIETAVNGAARDFQAAIDRIDQGAA